MRLECGCGYVADGTSEDEFVFAAQTHARTAHGMSLTAQQILGVAHEGPSSLSRSHQPTPGGGTTGI